MEGIENFEVQLAKCLQTYDRQLSTIDLPKLKDGFVYYHASLKAILNVLLRKGLIQEDPYKNDQKLSEIQVPDNSPFLESAKSDEMSIRLSNFESQLDFLLHYYQFSSEFLNLGRIKKMHDLLGYIKWKSLNPNSTHITTRALAEIIEKITKGADPLSIGLINDSISQLQKSEANIITILKKLTIYHREFYKFEVRGNVMTLISLDGSKVFDQKNEVLKLIKKKFAQTMPGHTFYPELIQEILQENYAHNAKHQQDEVLKKLEVIQTKKKKVDPAKENRELLLASMRQIASSARALEDSAQKLVENSQILQTRKLSFGERFRRWILKMVNPVDDELIYVVEYFDINTSATKTEKIKFDKFIDEIRKKAKIYSGIAAKVSPLYKKLEVMEESEVYSYLEREEITANKYHHKLEALDTFFKTEVPKEQRIRVRGIKNELTALKNAIISTKQKKHEYVAKVEEIEQLKKLGINLD